MSEIWIESIYTGVFVSNHGRVKCQDKVLEQVIRSDGYEEVTIKSENEDKICLTYKLVAESFLGVLSDGYVTHHKDGNKLNNHLNNLEYISRKEHAYKHAHLKWNKSNDIEKLRDVKKEEKENRKKRGRKKKEIIIRIYKEVNHKLDTKIINDLMNQNIELIEQNKKLIKFFENHKSKRAVRDTIEYKVMNSIERNRIEKKIGKRNFILAPHSLVKLDIRNNLRPLVKFLEEEGKLIQIIEIKKSKRGRKGKYYLLPYGREFPTSDELREVGFQSVYNETQKHVLDAEI